MKSILKYVLPVPIVLVGAAVLVGLVKSKSAPEQAPPEEAVSLVDVMEVRFESRPSMVHATGTVSASRQLSLTPQVGGEITWVANGLAPGARFSKGDTIARIDRRDYEIQVQSEQSRVKQAELELALEQGRGAVAAKERALLGGETNSALARREPQLAASQEGLEAAQGALRKAELSLARTTLRAPFNAMVVSENLEVGQVIGTQGSVATLIGTDTFWVNVSVPVDRLGLISIPGINGTASSAVKVVQPIGSGKTIVRQGRVVKLGAQLDPETRTAELLVAVESPLAGEGIPLLPGAFVDVAIEGTATGEVMLVPRSAVYEGARVWTVGDGDVLEPVTVSVDWGDGESVAISSGLTAGTRVVTTPLTLPLRGARVEVRESVAVVED